MNLYETNDPAQQSFLAHKELNMHERLKTHTVSQSENFKEITLGIP